VLDLLSPAQTQAEPITEGIGLTEEVVDGLGEQSEPVKGSEVLRQMRDESLAADLRWPLRIWNTPPIRDRPRP
jgi:hypothetical protein